MRASGGPRAAAAIVAFLLYVMQQGASLVPAAVHATSEDVCCEECSRGGTCCCLVALGAVACTLPDSGGLGLRQAPCMPGMPAVSLSAPTTARHLPPPPVVTLLPAGGLVAPVQEPLPAYSVEPVPPGKIPIA